MFTYSLRYFQQKRQVSLLVFLMEILHEFQQLHPFDLLQGKQQVIWFDQIKNEKQNPAKVSHIPG